MFLVLFNIPYCRVSVGLSTLCYSRGVDLRHLGIIHMKNLHHGLNITSMHSLLIRALMPFQFRPFDSLPSQTSPPPLLKL